MRPSLDLGDPAGLISAGPLQSVVVICTKDRPSEVEMAIRAIARTTDRSVIVVNDSSDNDLTLVACRRLEKDYPLLAIKHLASQRPGLARQRNEAAEFCQTFGASIVHFLDDDTEVLPGYFDVIERRFRDDPVLVGVGGVIDNFPGLGPTSGIYGTISLALRRCFMLWSSRPGRVLRSGRNISAQIPWVVAKRKEQNVEYLSGCAMSWRIDTILQFRFDERLEGYSFGEDVDFGWRVSRTNRLVVSPDAHCLHHLSPYNRWSHDRQGFEHTIFAYKWVRDHDPSLRSLSAFWWSVIGDFILSSVKGLIHQDERALTRGIARAALLILRMHLHRSASIPPVDT